MENLTLVRRIQKSKSFIVSIFFLALLAASFSPNTSFAFSDAKITFDGIGDIDIMAIQNNVDGGGVTADNVTRKGNRSMFTLFIQIPLNEKFPQLFLKAAIGELIKDVTINFEEGVYSIKLTDVVIASLEFSDLLDEDAMFMMGLSFGKIEWTYDGVTTGMDLQTNRPIY